ncbi:MAG TPA: PAS domain S-box protein [Clostridia bacterium]|nr:PAS domain S-box protein [Clostridia bacterium]
MGKNLKVLYVTESESDIQKFVQILEEANYSVVPIWISISEVMLGSLKTDGYDLIILDATRGQHHIHETNIILNTLGTEKPIVTIINDKADQDYFDTLEIPCFDYLLLKDIFTLGRIVKHLFRELHLHNRIHAIEDEFEKEIERLTTTLASIGDGVITADIDGNANELFLYTFDISSVEILNERIGRVFGCHDSLDIGKGCGHGSACHECKLKKALEEVISLSKTIKDLEIKKVLTVNNQEVERCFRINAVPLLLCETKHVIVVIDDITEYRKLEENLIKSRDYYLTLFENFPAMIWRADCSKKCNYFNKSWLDFTGRTMEQEIGDGWTEGVHSEDIEMCFRIYSEAFGARESFEMEYRLRNKDGQYRWILDIGRPFYDIDSKFLGYIGACFDITERKIAEEGLRRYRLLSQNANDIILFADINGYVIEANDAAIRAYGYDKEELLNKSIFYLVNPDPKSPVGAQPYQANARGIYYEATAYRKNGSTFTAEVSMQGTEIGSSKVLMAILRDVTERKLINEELKQAKESAEAANHAKSEFLANMSHEIRTPLNGMIGMIDLTLLTGLTEEQKDNLYTAKECAGTLLNLINDILDFSKIEAGKLKIEYIDFNIKDLLEQTVRPHVIRARGKGLLLKYKADGKMPQVVNGDPYRLKQVINNLLGNAVKFTDSGEVNLSARLVTKNDEYVELEFLVSDTGIGMTSEDIERLFYSFSQVDSSHTRKYGGTGLGLAISKQLVEMMGGSIWVKSIKGNGSTFYFTVKLRSGNTAADTLIPVVPVRKTRHPLRILLVEDDKINQLVTTRIILETGHKVITANNGIEALQILIDENIDVILMDIQMPEMDGIETTKRIRKREETTGSHILIIALTAYALQGDREKFLSIGMDGYISKPIQINSFLNTVETITERLSGSKAVGMASRNNDDNSVNEAETNKFLTEYAKSVEPLLKSMDVNINLLKCSIKQNDLSSIERYAHVIKKLSSEISATTVKGAAFKVELAARRGNITEAVEYFDLVTEEFLKYKKHIRSYKNS